MLLHDFNEIDRNLVDPKSIYTSLKNEKELESWRVEDWSLSEDNLTKMQSDYIGFFEGMLVWYNDFKMNLLSDSLAFQGMAYKQAAEKIYSVNIKWDKVWFVGLNAFYSTTDLFESSPTAARFFWFRDQVRF